MPSGLGRYPRSWRSMSPLTVAATDSAAKASEPIQRPRMPTRVCSSPGFGGSPSSPQCACHWLPSSESSCSVLDAGLPGLQMPEQQLVHAAAGQPLRGVLGVAVAAHTEAGEPVSAPRQHIPRRDAPPQQVPVPLRGSGVAEVVGDELVTGRAAHHQPGQPARQPAVDGPLRTVPEQRAVRADVSGPPGTPARTGSAPPRRGAGPAPA